MLRIVVALLLLSVPAHAGVFYQYTGNIFTFTDPILGTPWVGGRMTALVEISSPPGGQRVGTGCSSTQPCTGTLDSWSLSAGPWTFTDGTPTVDDITPFFVTLSADASSIDFWQLAAVIPTPTSPLELFLETSHHAPSGGGSDIDLVHQFGIGTLAKAGPDDAGTWERLSGSPIIGTVIEPSTLAIFALGLAGLGFMRRRRRRAM